MLGLLTSTDARWIERAKSDLASVLVDHAHCEMKAASNALALSTRCIGFADVTRQLVELAEEELRHFRQVLDEIERRGLTLGPPEEDFYAAELRRRVGKTRHRHDLASHVIADRLLVGALIEARSCERFKLLAPVLRESDPRLADFYDELFVAEARHHRVFIDLAALVLGDEAAARVRLTQVAAIEGELVAALPSTATVHG